MTPYTYLLIDIFTILIPFIYSFHSKILFYKTWKSFFIATLVAAIPFLLWDEFFTAWKIWGFNPKYITGIYIGELPLEEILFFVCIPYSCVFTYYCFKKFGICLFFNTKTTPIFSLLLGVSLLAIGCYHFEKAYTSTTFVLMGLFTLWHQFVRKSTYLSAYYFAYSILLLPFFIVNGILTGSGLDSPIVWYDNTENLGIRLGTIPVEDTFYGMMLILLNLTIYEHLEQKRQNSSTIG